MFRRMGGGVLLVTGSVNLRSVVDCVRFDLDLCI